MCNREGEILSRWSVGADSRRIRCPRCFRLGWVQRSLGLMREDHPPNSLRPTKPPKPSAHDSRQAEPEESPPPESRPSEPQEPPPLQPEESQSPAVLPPKPNESSPSSVRPPPERRSPRQRPPQYPRPPRPDRGGGGVSFPQAFFWIPLAVILGIVGCVALVVWNGSQDTPVSGSTPTRVTRESPAQRPTSSTPIETRTPAPTATPTPTLIPVHTSTPPPISMPAPTPTQMPIATPAPTSTPTPLEELREYALQLINIDRVNHGVNPVVLGTNPAAQMHAQDMLEHDYFGHWWINGMKPYMVYSVTGGSSYVAENAATDGWTLRRWREKDCDSFLVRCVVPKPKEAIEELHWSMMYDDADSDWGHRDNILDEGHRAVNIGIAFNNRRVTFIQHFEGGDVEALEPPSLAKDGTFTLTFLKVQSGLDIGRVASIYYDPLPVPMTAAQIDSLDSYCLGGGATTRCGDPVVRILPPPGPGRYYAQLDANEVVADVWAEDEDSFRLTAYIGDLVTRPGVYTVVIWKDSGTTRFSERLLALSILPEQ